MVKYLRSLKQIPSWMLFLVWVDWMLIFAWLFGTQPTQHVGALCLFGAVVLMIACGIIGVPNVLSENPFYADPSIRHLPAFLAHWFIHSFVNALLLWGFLLLTYAAIKFVSGWIVTQLCCGALALLLFAALSRIFVEISRYRSKRRQAL